MSNFFSEIYKPAWFYFQWFVKNKAVRRPFTYCMRDHPWIFWAIVTPVTGLCAWLTWPYYSIIFIYFHGMLLSHLWWGSKIQKGQQEQPEYNPDSTATKETIGYTTKYYADK
jgi:hypothetical protein